MPTKLIPPLLMLAVACALALGACGGKDDDAPPTAESATPAEAIKEIGATRAGLDKALDQLRSGDRSAAEETVSETYVEHFEIVEGPLEKVDATLKDSLESSIAGDLRRKIATGAPAAEVAVVVKSLKADLKSAEAKLQ